MAAVASTAAATNAVPTETSPAAMGSIALARMTPIRLAIEDIIDQIDRR